MSCRRSRLLVATALYRYGRVAFFRPALRARDFLLERFELFHGRAQLADQLPSRGGLRETDARILCEIVTRSGRVRSADYDAAAVLSDAWYPASFCLTLFGLVVELLDLFDVCQQLCRLRIGLAFFF